MAGSAFKDADVLKALSTFTPILVDKDTEKDAVAKYRVGGIPDVVFADGKGVMAGHVVGAVPVPNFLKSVQDIAKKVKPGAPSKDYATLTGAKTDLDAALAKKKAADALAAIAKIEKVNRPGAILDAALAAKKQLLEDGQKRLDAAKESAKTDKDAALKELKALAKDYKGADIGAEAAKLVKELEPPPEAGK